MDKPVASKVWRELMMAFCWRELSAFMVPVIIVEPYLISWMSKYLGSLPTA